MIRNSDVITDADLIRLLDHELDERADAELRERVAAQPDARARFEQLSVRSQRMHVLLDETGPNAHAVRASAGSMRHAVTSGARSQGIWLRAAAIVLLVGSGLFVPPVRAWIIERALSVAESIGLREPADAAPPSTDVPRPAQADTRVAFPVSGAEFDITVPRMVGSMNVVRGAAAGTGEIDATGVAGLAHTIMPSGLQLHGVPAPGAVYSLRLPDDVRFLTIRAPDGVVTRHPLPPAPAGIRIELGAR